MATLPTGKIKIVVIDDTQTITANLPQDFHALDYNGCPEVSIGLVSNMFVRQMDFKHKGDSEHGHEHHFDHLTLLSSGKLIVEANGESTEYVAPAMIYIKKDVTHKLTASVENTVAYCIHGLRDKDKSDDILAPDMVPNGVELSKIMSEVRKR